MLVRIKGKTINQQIHFEIPSLYFDSKSYVALQQIVIDFKKIQSSINGQLSSSLIDRSQLNPDQVLADFQQLIETKTLVYQPTHLQYYKIQRMDLMSSEFKISFREKTQKREIETIELLLHILDARVQSRLEQSIH